MYNEFYGFSQKPFEIAPDPKFLYYTSNHWDALDAMMKGIKMRQGFISVIGEVGTGKTTLIHALLANLDKKVKTAFIFHTSLTFEELLEAILRELYLEVSERDKESLLRQLIEYLSKLEGDETVTIILDEAQLLTVETLQELGELHDRIPQAAKRLQIIFVGQPEFKNILNAPGLEILNQRIGIRRELKTLTAEESRDYIQYRLKHVGSSIADTFTYEAISEITRHARGIPRIINIVCDNAFISGFAESKRKIDAKVIRDVIKNLDGPSGKRFKPVEIAESFKKDPEPGRLRSMLTSKSIAVILLSLLVAGGIIFAAYGLLRHGNSSGQTIASKWTSFFHAERTSVSESRTANSEVYEVAAAQPGISGETRLVKDIIVKKGQSISRLVTEHYGMSNLTRADLILDYNPGITNANLIEINQKIRMPKISEQSIIVPLSDGTYKIHVGTFSGREFARIYRAEPLLKGKEVEVIARKVAPRETWYRVVVGKFESTDEALKIISALKEKNLLPLFGASPKLK